MGGDVKAIGIWHFPLGDWVYCSVELAQKWIETFHLKIHLEISQMCSFSWRFAIHCLFCQETFHIFTRFSLYLSLSFVYICLYCVKNYNISHFYNALSIFVHICLCLSLFVFICLYFFIFLLYLLTAEVK